MESEEKADVHLTEYLIQFVRFMIQKTQWCNIHGKPMERDDTIGRIENSIFF